VIEDYTTTTMGERQLPQAALQRCSARVVFSPDEEAVGREITLDGGLHILGRGVEGNTIKDRRMSREHARIRRSGEMDLIEDLGSSNGTSVNSAKIDRPTELSPGDVINVGDTILVVDQELPPDRLPASPSSNETAATEIIGISWAARQLRRSIATVASELGAVLLLGPTGSGKEITAAAIHRLSRRSGEWVPINCAAIPAEIAESELFGSRKGAYTGAIDRDGCFVQADGGTLFLDEIGDLMPQVQTKLLRVLQESTIQPLGATTRRKVDVRVVAATHADLAESGFRRDLYARIGDWVLHLPPLAARRADILVLFDHFLRASGKKRRPMTPEFAHALLLYDWPMNVRELQKLAHRVSTLAGDEPFNLGHLPDAIQRPVRARASSGTPIAQEPPKPESEDDSPGRLALETALRNARGNVRRAAQELSCHRTQLYRWIKRFNIDVDSFR
jgi:transcriptional regulator with GAF, ATPase, and Fis domain